jgi:hypothetical protein
VQLVCLRNHLDHGGDKLLRDVVAGLCLKRDWYSMWRTLHNTATMAVKQPASCTTTTQQKPTPVTRHCQQIVSQGHTLVSILRSVSMCHRLLGAYLQCRVAMSYKSHSYSKRSLRPQPLSTVGN